MKKLIFNADDFGMSAEFNEAVKQGFNNGFLSSTSVCANGEAFIAAMTEVLPECKGLGIGVHLNIIEGKTLRKNISKSSMLCDLDGNYKLGYLKLLTNSGNKNLLEEIEADFRIQIEKVLDYTTPTHIDSHVHTHSIPPIFEITAKLAKEYNVPFIRTQHEKFYLIPNICKHLNLKYPPNLIKIGLLNYLTDINNKTVKKYNLKTNNYLIGVGYTGFMDAATLEYGLKSIKNNDCITEMIIHPCVGQNFAGNNERYIEFMTTQNHELRTKISEQNWVLTNYREIN